MPFLSMILKPWWETRNFTHRFSLWTQKRRSWIFGLNTRLVLLLACETLLPDITRFPVTWQTLAMALTLNEKQYEGRDLYQIPRLFPRAVRILALNYTTTPAAPVFPRNRANR
jgi:hypothetical protein|tara:strand:- start:270 stop:608 length:339 start_codon:yes stop_codon:yes gene_type:complete